MALTVDVYWSFRSPYSYLATPRLVEIGYAHVHAGMALYLEDVELMEELASIDARMAVPSSVNIANADTVNWKQTGAPESLARLQRRAAGAHAKLGSDCTFTCTPYWAGHWPTWNTHMTSIESTVTIFCNSVLGARSNAGRFMETRHLFNWLSSKAQDFFAPAPDGAASGQPQ